MLTDHRSRYHKFILRLRQARKTAGLSQDDVATLLGKPQSFVSKCETGERRVDALELQIFARIYGKSIEYFLDTESE